MERQLASIQRVEALFPIPEADKIEGAQILGWQCITKKGELSPNEPCVYFEIDSFLPADDVRFEFLSKQFKEYNGVLGARIKTIKMRGQLSQGLALPLSMFPELAELPVGTDVTETLRVTKWEPPYNEPCGPVAGQPFPYFLRKTDQQRLQSCPEVLTEATSTGHWEVSIKLDGSSMTVFALFPDSSWYSRYEEKYPDMKLANDMLVGVCSRNILVDGKDNPFYTAAQNTGAIEKLVTLCKATGRCLALQGELVGPGIQGNYENTPKKEYYVYSIWDIDTQRMLRPDDARNLTQAYNIPYVPVLFDSLSIWDLRYETLLALADGRGMNIPQREGVVFKSLDGRRSFKIVSNAYLLKTGK